MEVSALILAGGQSRRFGPQPKALSILGGMSLLEHVVERLLPQVASMALSVERRNPMFNTFGLEQVEDPEPGANGPLPALLAGLRWLKSQGKAEWLQLAPCDTPFLPRDLVGRLGLQAAGSSAPVCVPRFRGEVHGTCSLWRLEALEIVEAAVADGAQGFKAFFEDHPVAILDWPEPHAGAVDPFFNINKRTDLERAEQLIS